MPLPKSNIRCIGVPPPRSEDTSAIQTQSPLISIYSAASQKSHDDIKLQITVNIDAASPHCNFSFNSDPNRMLFHEAFKYLHAAEY